MTARRVLTGPPGPTGPVGPAGPGAVRIVHVQEAAAFTWVIDHNLGYEPASVSVRDSGGSEVIGEVVHDSNNRVRILFNSSFGGKAVII